MEFSKNNLLQSLQVHKSQWYVIRIKIGNVKIIAAIGTDDELWREILIAETFPALASVFNIVSNFLLILVTFHAKYYNNKYFLPISITFFRNLRTSCNILIAFDAICIMLAQPTQLAHFSYVIGRHYIPMSSCFYSTVVSVYGLQSSSIMPLLIGFDRFMTVFFPFWFLFSSQ